MSGRIQVELAHAGSELRRGGPRGRTSGAGRGLASAALLAAILAAVTALGCSSPCTELAELGCERAGEQSEHCERLREQARRAEADEQRACTRALRLVDTLGKNR